jgi:hypothetical protein
MKTPSVGNLVTLFLEGANFVLVFNEAVLRFKLCKLLYHEQERVNASFLNTRILLFTIVGIGGVW